MASQMRWTDERIKEAADVVKAFGSVAEAANHLTSKWGIPISRSSVRHALVGNGYDISQLMEAGRVETVKEYGPEVEPPPDEEVEPDISAPDTMHSESNPPTLAWQKYTPASSFKIPDLSKTGRSTSSKMRRGFIIPDTHVPLVHKKAWSCALGILKEWNPDFGVIIGDFLEMGSLSKHAKSKPDLVRLSGEYYSGNLALDALQNNSPRADWTYIEGNHEYRARRFCAEFGVLDGMLDVPEQLFIRPRADAYHRSATGLLRGMHWVPYEDQPYITPHSAYYHGHHKTNKYHAAWHAEIYCSAKTEGRPLFYGHMHTFQSFTAENGCSAQCVGFLGDEPALHYTEGKPTGWSHGIVLQEIDEDGMMTYQVVRIKNGKAVYQGRSIIG